MTVLTFSGGPEEDKLCLDSLCPTDTESCTSQKAEPTCLVECFVASFFLGQMFVSQNLAGHKSMYMSKRLCVCFNIF